MKPANNKKRPTTKKKKIKNTPNPRTPEPHTPLRVTIPPNITGQSSAATYIYSEKEKYKRYNSKKTSDSRFRVKTTTVRVQKKTIWVQKKTKV